MRKEIVIPMKLWLIELASILFLIVGSIAGTFLITRYRTINEIGTVNREYFAIKEKEIIIDEFENNKYKVFLKDTEKAAYIINTCNNFGLDPDIAIAILEVENPSVEEDAINRNQNKSTDIGLFQLNDKSLYENGGFLDRWWTFDSKDNFDPYNWKQNAYIAIKYICLLEETFGKNNPRWIAAGYNAGLTRASNLYLSRSEDKLPESTRKYYMPLVENNYNKWKSMENY